MAWMCDDWLGLGCGCEFFGYFVASTIVAFTPRKLDYFSILLHCLFACALCVRTPVNHVWLGREWWKSVLAGDNLARWWNRWRREGELELPGNLIPETRAFSKLYNFVYFYICTFLSDKIIWKNYALSVNIGKSTRWSFNISIKIERKSCVRGMKKRCLSKTSFLRSGNTFVTTRSKLHSTIKTISI